MQLADTLFGFLLERLRRGREIGVFIAEQLVGDFSGEQYADIRINEDGLSMGETVEKVLAIFGDIRGES